MTSEYKQSTIAEMIDSERLMVLEAQERYPRFYPHAEEAAHFLSTFIKSIKADRWIFGSFLSHAKKHAMLALFSTVRLHQVQAHMNLRQVLEAGAAAAFAIANPEHGHFVDTDEHGILAPSQELTKKRYKWLEDKYPDSSAAIKGLKATVNQLGTHANLVSADNSFRINEADGSFDAPFFDIEDEYLVKTDLWMTGNIAIGLMELFYVVDANRGFITFVDDFLVRLNKLQAETQALRSEMMGSERYMAVQHLTSSKAPGGGND